MVLGSSRKACWGHVTAGEAPGCGRRRDGRDGGTGSSRRSLELHLGPPLPPLSQVTVTLKVARGCRGLSSAGGVLWRRVLLLWFPRSPAILAARTCPGSLVGPPERSAQPALLELALAAARAHWAGVQPVPVRLGLCGVSTEVSVPAAPHPYLGPLPVRGSPKEPPSQKLTRPSTGRPTPPRAWLCCGPNPEQGPGRWG